ncbi:MAG: PH domain-containing protein [Patescibacteria group bacterium]
MIPGRLPNWQKNERIELLLRRHPWIMIRSFLFFLLLAVIPFAIYFAVEDLSPEFFDNDNTLINALVIIGASVYALMAWMFIFTAWIDYYLDVWIVTNERIISMELKGLFARTTAEQRIGRVQDVSSIQKGKIATLLNYGNVQIQTAGTENQFLFSQVGSPEKVAQKVLQIHDQWLQSHPREAQQLAGVLSPGMSVSKGVGDEKTKKD